MWEGSHRTKVWTWGIGWSLLHQLISMLLGIPSSPFLFPCYFLSFPSTPPLVCFLLFFFISISILSHTPTHLPFMHSRNLFKYYKSTNQTHNYTTSLHYLKTIYYWQKMLIYFSLWLYLITDWPKSAYICICIDRCWKLEICVTQPKHASSSLLTCTCHLALEASSTDYVTPDLPCYFVFLHYIIHSFFMGCKTVKAWFSLYCIAPLLGSKKLFL